MCYPHKMDRGCERCAITHAHTLNAAVWANTNRCRRFTQDETMPLQGFMTPRKHSWRHTLHTGTGSRVSPLSRLARRRTSRVALRRNWSLAYLLFVCFASRVEQWCEAGRRGCGRVLGRARGGRCRRRAAGRAAFSGLHLNR